MRSGFGSPPAGQVSRPNGARCARGSKTSMLLSLPYNATKISQEVLPPTDLLPALGLPLTAMACKATDSGVLQRWREVPDGTLQLVDQPSFCLGIGPRKAPKAPYPILAQLHECPGKRDEEHGSRSLLVYLMYDRVASRIRSRASLTSLRRVLVGAARSVFGPADADRVGRQLREKGKSRRQRATRHRAARSSSKKPFWQDGRMKREVGRDEDESRLCLGTWRGQMSAGTSVVFVPCTQREGVDTVLTSDSLVRFGDTDRALCVSARTPGVAWTSTSTSP